MQETLAPFERTLDLPSEAVELKDLGRGRDRVRQGR